METRAHHLLIGSFMLLMIVALFAFIIWLAKVDIDQEFNRFDIFFTGSIAGLSEGGPVQYNGVPVGQVTDITIPADQPNQVRVTVRLRSDVPILQGSTAVLEAQGLTGFVLVQIEGGRRGAPPIEAEAGQPRPVIPSKPSALQELFQEAPNLLSEAILVLGRVKELVSEENTRRVANILSNVNEVTGALASRSDEMEATLVELEQTVSAIRQTSESLNRLIDKADGLAESEVRTALADASRTIQAAESLLTELDETVDENRGAISTFTNNTLPEVSRLVLDLRRLAASLKRITEEFEQNPTGVLFGTPQPEYTDGEED